MARLEKLYRSRVERDPSNPRRRQRFVRLAVVGAGWAGLAAAVHLKAQAPQVTVFEAAPLPGGRARRVDDLQMGAIDNGQHLLLGAYTETLALMRTLRPALPLSELLQRFPMHLESAAGDFCLKAAPLAAPFHTLWGLLNANGLTWTDRWQALRMLTSLKLQRWQVEPSATVAQLLRQHGQSALLRRRLWIPLCLATLNTSEDEACAQLFLNVLRDSMDAPRAHSDMLLARVDLTTLWPQAAADAVAMRYRQVVRNVHPTSSQVVIDGEAFDGCVVAVPPYAAARMLTPEKPCAQSEALLAQLQA